VREEKDSPSRLWNGGQDETREEIKWETNLFSIAASLSNLQFHRRRDE
jgi:hypothetical protein